MILHGILAALQFTAGERDRARQRAADAIKARRKHRLHVATVAAHRDMGQRDIAALREKLRDEYHTGLDSLPDDPLQLQER